jgi:hypothetical protein
MEIIELSSDMHQKLIILPAQLHRKSEFFSFWQIFTQ